MTGGNRNWDAHTSRKLVGRKLNSFSRHAYARGSLSDEDCHWKGHMEKASREKAAERAARPQESISRAQDRMMARRADIPITLPKLKFMGEKS